MPTMPKRNYFDRNGSRWVVQGELLIKADAKVTVEPGAVVPFAMPGENAVAEMDYGLLVGALMEELPLAELQAAEMQLGIAADPGECKATTVAACVAWCNQLRKSLLDAGILGVLEPIQEEAQASTLEMAPASQEPPSAAADAPEVPEVTAPAT